MLAPQLSSQLGATLPAPSLDSGLACTTQAVEPLRKMQHATRLRLAFRKLIEKTFALCNVNSGNGSDDMNEDHCESRLEQSDLYFHRYLFV